MKEDAMKMKARDEAFVIEDDNKSWKEDEQGS
jgi:hypothetical protein